MQTLIIEEMTIKNLFTKHEHRMFPGMTKEQAIQGAAWYWRSRQFGINFTSAYALAGAQFYSKLGLKQQVSVTCFDIGQGVGIDVNFSAELTDEGAVVGAVGAMLVLPVTVVIGAVSYMEYENDANRMLTDFWTYVSSNSSDPRPPAGPPSTPVWVQGQETPSKAVPATSAQMPLKCPGCCAPVDPGSKFCKYCGAWL